MRQRAWKSVSGTSVCRSVYVFGLSLSILFFKDVDISSFLYNLFMTLYYMLFSCSLQLVQLSRDYKRYIIEKLLRSTYKYNYTYFPMPQVYLVTLMYLSVLLHVYNATYSFFV